MAELAIDFHTHLLEKGVKPKAYWKAVKARKLGAIAITEHSYEKPGLAYEMLFEEKPKGIALIPGMEITSEAGHMLVLGKDQGIYDLEKLFGKKVLVKDALELAKKHGFVLSISHPWGFSNDSAAFILGEKKLNALVEKKKIGVEAFNGMFGNIGSFFYSTNWVKKPMNFFDFLEKSRIGRKTRLSRLGAKGKEKLDRKGREIIERGIKPFELAQKAAFITAGSDAHSPQAIGSGIVKLEVKGKAVPEGILEALQDKGNVKWAGPYIRETKQGIAFDRITFRKKDVLSGIKYAAKSKIVGKVRGKRANS